MLNTFSQRHALSRTSRRVALFLASPRVLSANLLVFAPVLVNANAQAPSIASGLPVTTAATEAARVEGREAMQSGKWAIASIAWRQVLLALPDDAEAKSSLEKTLTHLQSRPENYEGLPSTNISVDVARPASNPQVVTRPAALEARTLTPTTRSNSALAPAPLLAQADLPATPLPLPAPAASTPATSPVVSPAAPIPVAVSPAPSRATVSGSRNVVSPPALAPLPAQTNVTGVPFNAPARRTAPGSAAKKATAWPLVNRAARLLNANRTSEALSLYRRAYAIDPSNEYAGNGVGTALVIQGQFAEAARAFLAALAYRPGDLRLLRGLANAYSYAGKSRESIGVNNAILAKSPRDFAANYQNGQLYTFLRSYTRADASFARAAEVSPRNPELWAAWGESLSYRRDRRAVANFRRALSLRPGFVRATLGLGNFYSYVGEFSSAIPQYQAVLRAEPRNLTALVGLGDALTYANQPEAAVAPYRTALNVQSTNRGARLGLGRALVYAGRSEEGARELNRVLVAEPGNVKALEALALAQGEASPRRALQTYQALLTRQTSPTERARTFAAIGDLRAASNELPQAVEAYRQAARLQPNDAAINLTYAQLLATREDWQGARPVIARVLTRTPNNPRALALQLQIEVKTGNTARAEQLAARLETVSPATPEDAIALADALREAGSTESANRILTRAAQNVTNPATALRIADAVRDSTDYPTATTIYNRLIASDPNNIGARIGLAKTLLYSQSFSAARVQAERALTIDPKNEAARLVLADINAAQNTPKSQDDAGKIYADILKTDPNNSAARAGIGQIFSQRGRFADAVNQYRISVAADPANNEARLGLARNLYYARDVDNAIEQYRELIRLTPADTLPRLELAQIFLDRNRFSDAEALYNEILALRQGAATLASVRRAIENQTLVRLAPSSRQHSILRPHTAAFALLKPRTVKRQIVDAPNAKKPRARALLAQNQTTVPPASGPLGPDSNGGSVVNDGSVVNGGSTAIEPLNLPSVPSTGTAPVAPNLAPAPLSETAPVAPAPTTPAPLSAAPLGAAAQDQTAALRGLGEIRRRQSRFTEASTFFNQALAINPNDVTARVGLAQSLRAQLNYTQALAEANRAVEIEGTSIPARVARAQLLADTGDAAGAKTELDSLLASIPETAPLDTFIQLAGALNTIENYDAALQLLDVAAEVYPNEPLVPRTKGETLTFARRFDEALKTYDVLIAADAQDADALVGKARVYNYSDRLTEAETTYRQALTLAPNNYQALTELADVEGRRADYTTSIALYNQAIEQNPTDLATRVNLAKVQRYSGANADSEATLNRVLEADSRYAPALVERGILRGAQGSYASGIADLQAALAITPTDLNAQIGLAEVQSYAGQFAQSIAGYQAVLQRDPQNLQARTQLALVQSYAGQTDAALATINAALTQNPNDLSARLARADIFARANRTSEAVSIYQAILASDPTNVRASTGLADAYLYGRRYNDAVRVYDRLIAGEPTNVNYKIQRARALGFGGNSREAVTALRAIVASQPNNLNARLALAEAGVNSGEAKLQNEGIATYRAILASDPTNVPAKIGLGRGLSYVGSYKAATQNLNEVLATAPENTEARYALAETQRFAGQPFDARENYQKVLATSPNNAQANAGLRETRRFTANSLTVGGGYYSDSNGVRLRSVNLSPVFRTRALTIGAIVERGRFSQGATRRDRNNIGLLLGKQFGPVSAALTISRLRYDGAPSTTLYNANLLWQRATRERYTLAVGKQDVFESDAAIAAGITAQYYRAGFTYPLARQIDFEGTATYYRYSDNNSRITLLPALYYRFKPTNPSFRVGVGYNYDDARESRDVPTFLYYAPQNYRAASILADYVVDSGPLRYGIFGSYALTNSAGAGGVNRPADTLFANVEYDVNDAFGLFASGGIVRAEEFRSRQINGGVNLRF